MPVSDPDRDTSVATLANGARVLVIRLPHVHTASVSVFIRTGSRNESARLNGISHVVEHMAFKGTTERDCQRINLDAERLGAEVNAHTDKDHTAFHMRGLARDAARFVQMLADITQNATFPPAELERERQVILHEYTEDEDDPLSTAYKLFDKLCYGDHPFAQPVIGQRRNIERITRADLLAHVQGQYSAANMIVGIAGNVDPGDMVREVERAFGTMPPGRENLVDAPVFLGGVAARRQSGASQAQVVIGYPIPALEADDHAAAVAAAVFGEGMSSPLMDELRERRGLVYYAACSADVMDRAGQFVVEASSAAEHLEAFFAEVTRLLAAHAGRVGAVDLERARNQMVVRSLQRDERPYQRLEDAAQDLFVFGRVRPRDEIAARLQAVSAQQVSGAFERMLAAPAAVALVGKLKPGIDDRVRRLFGA